MPSNTHDPKTVATVAEAMRAYDEANTDEDGWFACSYPELAVAALDALTELGWRPGLTEQEREALKRVIECADAAVDTVDEDEKGAFYFLATADEFREFAPDRIRDDANALRALLSGGRHG